MKQVTIVACSLFIFCLVATGQISKKNWLMGGNITFNSTSYNSDAGQKTTGYVLDIAPDVGYFIANKWAAGVRINFHEIGSKATGTTISSTYTTANYGVFTRYYFLPKEKLVNILLDGAYQYGVEKGGSFSMSKNTIAIMGGPVVYFNSSVGLEFLIGYSTYKYTGVAGSNNTIQLGLGFHIHLLKAENNF